MIKAKGAISINNGPSIPLKNTFFHSGIYMFFRNAYRPPLPVPSTWQQVHCVPYQEFPDQSVSFYFDQLDGIVNPSQPNNHTRFRERGESNFDPAFRYLYNGLHTISSDGGGQLHGENRLKIEYPPGNELDSVVRLRMDQPITIPAQSEMSSFVDLANPVTGFLIGAWDLDGEIKPLNTTYTPRYVFGKLSASTFIDNSTTTIDYPGGVILSEGDTYSISYDVNLPESF